MPRPSVAALLCAVVFAHRLSAQGADASSVTIQRLFETADFESEEFGPARWLANGTAYTTLEPSTSVPGGQDLVRYDAESGRRSLLVPAERLVPPRDSTPLTIEDYHWSPHER